MGKPFIRLIKDNISSWFRSFSKDVLSAFSIFDPKKVPSLSTHELPLYGDSSIQTLIGQFGEIHQLNHWKELNLRKQPLSHLTSAQSRKRIVSSLLKPKDDVSMQLKELLTNDMLIALLPNLHKLATICCLVPLQHQRNEVSQT